MGSPGTNGEVRVTYSSFSVVSPFRRAEWRFITPYTAAKWDMMFTTVCGRMNYGYIYMLD